MKYVLLAFALVLSSSYAIDVHKVDKNMAIEKVSEADDTVWIDAKDIPMEGNGFWPKLSTNQFHRLPPDAKGKVADVVYGLASHTAGLSFRFNTDSKFIHLKWVPSGSTIAGYCDIYSYVNDTFGWRYKNCRIYLNGGKEKEHKIDWTPNTPCWVYLPCYLGVSSFKVGLSKGAKIWSAPARKSGIVKPIVFYGTSITHGAWGSRPGMSFVNIIGRKLDVPVVNLGFSGNGNMEPPMVEYLAKIDASCYVIDTAHNTATEYYAPGGRCETFMRNLRQLKPNVPIVLCETTDCCQFSGTRKFAEKDAKIRAMYERLLDSGMTGLSYVPAEIQYAPDDEGSMDTSHPNDWGMMHIAYAYGDAIADAMGIARMKKLIPHEHSPYAGGGAPEPPKVIPCEGWYDGHLQGVATDGKDVFWSFTKTLVRTDSHGRVLASARVPSHHGDPCYKDGKLYVAVNQGQFNQQDKAKSSVMSYDARTLKHLNTWPIDMPHGAGGMTSRGDRFYVVGGLPSWIEVNYVYEYDADFRLVKRHELKTGFTLMGIQTAHWDGKNFLFGIYGGTGNPGGVLVCDPALKSFKRYQSGGAEGILHLNGYLYIAGLLHNKQATDDRKNGARLSRANEELVFSRERLVSYDKPRPVGRLILDLGGDTAPYTFGKTPYRYGQNGYASLSLAGGLIAPTEKGKTDYNAFDVSKEEGYSIPDIVRGVQRISTTGETLVLRSRGGICSEGMTAEVYHAVVSEANKLGVNVIEFRK